MRLCHHLLGSEAWPALSCFITTDRLSQSPLLSLWCLSKRAYQSSCSFLVKILHGSDPALFFILSGLIKRGAWVIALDLIGSMRGDWDEIVEFSWFINRKYIPAPPPIMGCLPIICMANCCRCFTVRGMPGPQLLTPALRWRKPCSPFTREGDLTEVHDKASAGAGKHAAAQHRGKAALQEDHSEQAAAPPLHKWYRAGAGGGGGNASLLPYRQWGIDPGLPFPSANYLVVPSPHALSTCRRSVLVVPSAATALSTSGLFVLTPPPAARSKDPHYFPICLRQLYPARPRTNVSSGWGGKLVVGGKGVQISASLLIFCSVAVCLTFHQVLGCCLLRGGFFF